MRAPAAVACRWSTDPPAEWAALEAGTQLFGRRRWLDAMAGRLGDEHRWLVGVRGGEGRAGLFATVLRGPCHPFFDPVRVLFGPSPLLPRPAPAGAPAPPAAAWFPCLLVMLPGYECFPVGAAGDAEVLDALVAASVELAAAERLAAVAYLYVARPQPALASALAGRGFARFPMGWRSDLWLSGERFDDYLRALGGHRRREVLRERRRLREVGVQVRTAPLAACADEVLRLRELHQRKYGHTFDRAGERRRLDLLAAAAPEDTTVFMAEAGGRTVALTLHVWDGEAWHAFLDGAEYGHPAARLAHFETTYYAPIEAAYRLGRRRLSYGYATEDTKRHRGCRCELVDGWVRTLDPAQQAVAELAAEQLRAWEAAG
ncbi:MAG TPA: peptidogalycan biosysnthesis protein [Candidatus Dormibacteraeota bacterium]|nr:peptidogalycan biosysnthesis protein [Candidatus Dormibacteraeota bacterium]